MVSSLVGEFAREKIVLVKGSGRGRLPFPLEGVTKLVDNKGHMLGIVMDKEVWDEFSEYLEYTNPEFWKNN